MRNFLISSDRRPIELMMSADKTGNERIHARLPYVKAEIIWAIQQEMCLQVEDFLARRTRALLLDARAAIESAPMVAKLMAAEMGLGNDWIKNQTDSFNLLAKNYLPA